MGERRGVYPYGRRGFILIGGIFAEERKNHPYWCKKRGGVLMEEEDLEEETENRCYFCKKIG